MSLLDRCASGWEARLEGDDLPARVLVAAPQGLLRDGLIAILRRRWPDWTFLQAVSFEIAARQLAEGDCELAILDAGLDDLRGVASIEAFSAACPECLLAVLGDSDERSVVMQYLGAGARGYIPKCATPMQLLRAVGTILAGGVFAPASLARRPAAIPPAQRWTEHPLDALAQLTDRQRDVFRLLAEGCATKTIARRLNLATGTVKVHLAAIYRILHVGGRAEALARLYAVDAPASSRREDCAGVGGRTAPIRALHAELPEAG